jgi:excisionase family DNA binding protein
MKGKKMNDSNSVDKRESGALLVDKREAAWLLSVCPRTIDNLIARRELPVRRIGRRVLIPRKALEQFVRRDHSTIRQDREVLVRVESTTGDNQ